MCHVSTTAPSAAALGERTVVATANFPVAAVILGLFMLACIASAVRKDPTQGFDEVAHASYVAYVQHTSELWPKLDDMRLIDPQTFRFTDEANYLNHPPMFYALLAAIGPRLEDHPQALLVYRLFNAALVSIGLAVLLGLGARFSRQEFYAYAVPLACIPVLVQLAGAVNNDNLAFLGGAVVTLAVWQLVATDRSFWLALALAGVVAASWAKLTGLLLTAGMVIAILAYLLRRGRMRWTWVMGASFALALAAAPYAIYAIQYGSPTPETPAQVALIVDGARAAGWADLPRKTFPEYFAHFVEAFVAGWMPTLGARNVFNSAMLAVPAAALASALAGTVLSLRRLWRRHETPLDVVVMAGTAALVTTFTIHVGYSYGRHLATGWLLDAYPRYYLPLAAIVPLAGLSLLAAIRPPQWRVGLLAFLIAGPILFRIFGAPLG